MTAANNARTAALEALIDSHAVELKLPTVRRQFRSVAEQAIREQQTPVEYLAALLEAETAERAERRERRRLIDARFPALKRLEDFRFDDNPKIPRATIAALAQGSWIDNNESMIFVGDVDFHAIRQRAAFASPRHCPGNSGDTVETDPAVAHVHRYRAPDWASPSVPLSASLTVTADGDGA